MRCFSCHLFSSKPLCDKCRKELFLPTIKSRQIGSLDVISFYRYSTIQPLLLHKHKAEGYRIFNYFSKSILQPFIESFLLDNQEDTYIIGIDEKIKNGYSHIACLTHHIKGHSSKILHASLLAKNSVTYAGKSLAYRLNNPRDFHYSGPSDIDAILVDDIITTGVTLQEAQRILTQKGVNVLFALTLADAKE